MKNFTLFYYKRQMLESLCFIERAPHTHTHTHCHKAKEKFFVKKLKKIFLLFDFSSTSSLLYKVHNKQHVNSLIHMYDVISISKSVLHISRVVALAHLLFYEVIYIVPSTTQNPYAFRHAFTRKF